MLQPKDTAWMIVYKKKKKKKGHGNIYSMQMGNKRKRE